MARKVAPVNIKLMVAKLPSEANLAAVCRELGVSRQSAYRWRARYAELGVEGLEERSSAPRQPFGRTDAAVEDAVVAARKALAEGGLDAGAESVWCRLVDEGLSPPSPSTVWRILTRRGQINPQPRKRPRPPARRFQRDRPNECWQGDDTHYGLVSGQEVRIINLLDDHSRLNVDSLAVVQTRSEHIWACFCRASSRYGVPAEFLNDNGRAYISLPDHAPSRFQRELAQLGVRHIHSRPYHPQTCGKVERFHQTQRRWLEAQPQAHTVAELQTLLDDFRDLYNQRRRHKAIGRRYPAEVWASQTPAAPAQPQPVKPDVTSHTVTTVGRVNVAHRLIIGVGPAWAGHHVTVIRSGDHATVIASDTGEIIRELTFDPTRTYQPRLWRIKP